MPPPHRLLFIDWLRGWALVVMIETHVFNVLLLAQLRQAEWFRKLTFLNGLVAPSFLFVSGFVFIAAAQKRLPDLRALRSPFWKQIRRIALVWAIGYVLHLPPFSFRSLFAAATGKDWLRFYRVDVLHSIAVTWLFLLLSVVLVRSASLLRWWLFAATVAVAAFTPYFWSIDFSPAIPPPVAGYLNNRSNSLFPIFPWSGFMLAGALCASWFSATREGEGQERFMAGLALLGGALLLLGYTLPPLSFLPRASAPDWRADPRSFLLRLGLVFLLLLACWLYGRWRAASESWILLVSRESLFVYVAHLTVLYGRYWNGESLADRLGNRQGPLVCAAASVALAVVMVFGARLWERFKRWRAPLRKSAAANATSP